MSMINPVSVALSGSSNRACLPLLTSFPAMLNSRYRHRFRSQIPASCPAGRATSCIQASRFTANAASSAQA